MSKIGLTPHINAQKGDFAKTVIMPGDPLRAKYIADNFLENAKLVSDVRGMLAYTGEYKGKKVSVMAHGMGNPSMGIYAYELYKFYDVDNIIRVGSCASYVKEIDLYEIIVSEESFSRDLFAQNFLGTDEEIWSTKATPDLIKVAKETSKEVGIKAAFGNTHAGQNFYYLNDNALKRIYKFWENDNLIGGEMESFALYATANALNKKAIALLTVANQIVTKKQANSEERQNAFVDMMKLSLEIAIKL